MTGRPECAPTGSGDPAAARSLLRRLLVLFAAPLCVYVLTRPLVGADAVALALAGAVPVAYSLALAVVRRRLDWLALISAIGFAGACVVVVLSGGGTLALKLHEAAVSFVIGLAMLAATGLGRPLPLARVLRLGEASRELDGRLGGMAGALLVLHALVHVALAASLSTDSYLVASRIVNWGSIAVGALALSAYLHRLRGRPEQLRAASGTDA